MTMYDGAKHTALEAEKARLQTEISTVATRMNDEYESDAWDGEGAPGKMARYQADNIKHATLSRELESVDRQIDKMESIRPISRAEHRANPMLDIRRRWCLRGPELLDEGERQVFCPERTPGYAAGPGAARTSRRRELLRSVGAWRPTTRKNPNSRCAAAALGWRWAIRPGPTSASESASRRRATRWATPHPRPGRPASSRALQYYGSVAANCYNFNTADGNNFHQNGLDTKDEEGTLLIRPVPAQHSGHQPLQTMRKAPAFRLTAIPTPSGTLVDVIFDGELAARPTSSKSRIEAFNGHSLRRGQPGHARDGASSRSRLEPRL